MKIDGAGIPARSKSSDDFRSPATARAFERLEARLLDTANPAAREELAGLLAELRAKAAEVSASDPRPYGRSIEHAIKKALIRAAHGRLPGAPTSLTEPLPVPLPMPSPVGPLASEPPEAVGTPPSPVTSLNVRR
jgi:hypothetical protein